MACGRPGRNARRGARGTEGKKMTQETITKVRYRWDSQAGAESGWYCESYSGNDRIDDSQYVWFPVKVDDYTHDQADALEAALAESFPDADIEFSE